ncbi:MAG: hypothetical protein UH853_00135 [Muribaculaceae bacterium]|nr:hypothetical protein [Muribaculaceae bacterium]
MFINPPSWKNAPPPLSAVFPVKFEWEAGKKYVYTFNFTNGGNAGYEDTDNDGEPDNTPVLVDLNVSVTVDDFTEAENSPFDTEMDTTPGVED